MRNSFGVIPSLLPGLRRAAVVSPAPLELSEAGGGGKEMAHTVRLHMASSCVG